MITSHIIFSDSPLMPPVTLRPLVWEKMNTSEKIRWLRCKIRTEDVDPIVKEQALADLDSGRVLKRSVRDMSDMKFLNSALNMDELLKPKDELSMMIAARRGIDVNRVSSNLHSLPLDQLTDELASYLVKCRPVELHVRSCAGLTSAGLKLIAETSSIQTLVLNDCLQLTLADFMCLRGLNLRKLVLTDTVTCFNTLKEFYIEACEKCLLRMSFKSLLNLTIKIKFEGVKVELRSLLSHMSVDELRLLFLEMSPQINAPEIAECIRVQRSLEAMPAFISMLENEMDDLLTVRLVGWPILHLPSGQTNVDYTFEVYSEAPREFDGWTMDQRPPLTVYTRASGLRWAKLTQDVPEAQLP